MVQRYSLCFVFLDITASYGVDSDHILLHFCNNFIQGHTDYQSHVHSKVQGRRGNRVVGPVLYDSSRSQRPRLYGGADTGVEQRVVDAVKRLVEGLDRQPRFSARLRGEEQSVEADARKQLSLKRDVDQCGVRLYAFLW